MHADPARARARARRAVRDANLLLIVLLNLQVLHFSTLSAGLSWLGLPYTAMVK
eukprot:SAG31_NODE_1031_length_10234_cov_6.100049_11_plen_54_part_00